MPARHLLLIALGAALAGCSTLESLNPFEDKKPPPLQGTRKPILVGEELIRPDSDIGQRAVELPRPHANRDWPQAGGFSDHAMHHLMLGDRPARAWSTNVGGGTSFAGFFRFVGLGMDRRLIAQPVVADGRIFALNSLGRVVAVAADTGSTQWSTDVLPRGEDEGDVGGGVGYAAGVLYVATGAGELLALDPASGTITWRVPTGAPVRGAPTIAGGRVFVVTTENELIAFETKAGARIWNYAGVSEPTAILGGANPAVESNIVVMPQSSGEIVALRVENGRQLWTERLAASRQINPITNIADITARPVIDRGVVYAVSNAGRLAAIDLRTGRRLWDIDIGGLQTPWIAGDWLFALSNEGQLIAVDRQGGRIRWSVQLNAYATERQRRDAIVWTGPVLAGDRLVVAGSHGEALAVSPYTGQVQGRIVIGRGVYISPVVANGTLYMLDDSGNLLALR
jgi:outer membrane protein assembly factor BamB